jgi:serine/threonine-protein kinase
VCHASYTRGERFCPLDGGAVAEEAADDPLIGSTVDGRYLVRRYIGRGGMGAVYEADHVGLDRRVALKLIADADADRDARARFRQEARSASKVVHGNVVQIFDVGVDAQGRDYLVMEYVEGHDLRKVVEAGPVAAARAISIGKQVLAGLGAIHAAGLVHRDIKPANILLADQHVKLMDFGIAKSLRTELAQTDTGTGRVVGTPQFMAPEQLADLEIDHRADLYAVGVTLFVLLAGKLPFDGTSFTNAAAAIAQDAPSLDTLRADLPAALVAAVSRALAKRPADRFADAAEFAAALDAVRDAAGDVGADAAASDATGAGAHDASASGSGGATVPERRSSRELEPRDGREERTVRGSGARAAAPPRKDEQATVKEPAPSVPTRPANAAGSTPRRRWPLVVVPLVIAVPAIVWFAVRGSGDRPAAKPVSTEPVATGHALIDAAVPDAAVADAAQPDRLAIAREAEARGELALAITAYQEVFAGQPSANVAYRLGDLYERIGDRERARTFFTRYLELAVSPPDREAITSRIARLDKAAATRTASPAASKRASSPSTPPSAGKSCVCEAEVGQWTTYLCSKRATSPVCECMSESRDYLCPVPYVAENVQHQRVPPKSEDAFSFRCVADKPECEGVDPLPSGCSLLPRKNTRDGDACSGFSLHGVSMAGTISCNWCDDGPGFRGENGDSCKGWSSSTGKPLTGTLKKCK